MMAFTKMLLYFSNHPVSYHKKDICMVYMYYGGFYFMYVRGPVKGLVKVQKTQIRLGFCKVNLPSILKTL